MTGPEGEPLDRTTTQPPRNHGAGGARFAVGSRIGPYTLLGFLGRGSCGEVWLAERDSTIAKSQLVLKLPLHAGIDLAAVRTEAEVWLRVGSHPNVLPMFEADIYDGQVVIVSEFAPDGTLKHRLGKHSGRAPTVDSAIDMALGILSGLEHLHSRGVVHRDLKPANILLQGDCPRIADFGLARFTDTAVTTGVAAGTPAYMAPEAFDGERSIQADLWAVGVILYELLSGSKPFPQTDPMALMKAIGTARPTPLPPGTPAPVEAVLHKCLEKDPHRRYATATDVSADLRTRAVPVVAAVPERPAATSADTLLHRLWDELDPDLQDALALAHNQARRENKDRISTRTFFAALARLQPGRLPELLGRLPEGSLPEPLAADVPAHGEILRDAPKLSSCVENALNQLGEANPAGHKLAAEDVFVDIAKFGTGPSVVRLRTHGVTPELIDSFVGQLGWQVVRR